MAARASKTKHVKPEVTGIELDAEQRGKVIENAISQIEKRYGKGTIMNLGQENIDPIEVIPTGALSLDLALGVGGVPRGRVVEVYGPESSGKTTLCLHILAEAQKAGGIAAFIDVETGSTWDLGGRAKAGPLEGASLTLVPVRRALWFHVAGANPGIALYGR